MSKIGLSFGFLFALLSIILGAFGAHFLKDKIGVYALSIYDKAVLYQMFNSLGILLLSIIEFNMDSLQLTVPIWCLIVGVILFSGSLYILAMTDVKWIGIITPIGGLLFIIGWALSLYKIISI